MHSANTACAQCTAGPISASSYGLHSPPNGFGELWCAAQVRTRRLVASSHHDAKIWANSSLLLRVIGLKCLCTSQPDGTDPFSGGASCWIEWTWKALATKTPQKTNTKDSTQPLIIRTADSLGVYDSWCIFLPLGPFSLQVSARFPKPFVTKELVIGSRDPKHKAQTGP